MRFTSCLWQNLHGNSCSGCFYLKLLTNTSLDGYLLFLLFKVSTVSFRIELLSWNPYSQLFAASLLRQV